MYPLWVAHFHAETSPLLKVTIQVMKLIATLAYLVEVLGNQSDIQPCCVTACQECLLLHAKSQK